MKTIKELEKEIEEANKGETIGGTDCDLCGIELECEHHSICENCQGAMLIQSKQICEMIEIDLRTCQDMIEMNQNEKWIHMEIVLKRILSKIRGEE